MQYTTTASLPQEVQEKYEIVGPLEGGPRFDLPNKGFIGLDLSKITLEQAALLVRRKWRHIREKQAILPTDSKPEKPVKIEKSEK